MLALRAPLPAAGLRASSRLAPRVSVICPSTKLYVGNLSWQTQKEDLDQLFSPYGTLEDVFVVTERETGRHRGFAFVTFESDEAAQAAINSTNETEFMGRSIRVNTAAAREDRPDGGRGRGRGRGSYGDREGGGRGYGRGYSRRDDGGEGGDGGERREYRERTYRSDGGGRGGGYGGRGGGRGGRGGFRREYSGDAGGDQE